MLSFGWHKAEIYLKLLQNLQGKSNFSEHLVLACLLLVQLVHNFSSWHLWVLVLCEENLSQFNMLWFKLLQNLQGDLVLYWNFTLDAPLDEFILVSKFCKLLCFPLNLAETLLLNLSWSLLEELSKVVMASL